MVFVRHGVGDERVEGSVGSTKHKLDDLHRGESLFERLRYRHGKSAQCVVSVL